MAMNKQPSKGRARSAGTSTRKSAPRSGSGGRSGRPGGGSGGKTGPAKTGSGKSGPRSTSKPSSSRPQRPLRPAKTKRTYSSAIRSNDEIEKIATLGQRLQIVLAAAGYGSRRNCEDLIVTGRVQVDGTIVDQLGARVFPDKQKIKVDGELLTKTRMAYIVVYKPKGYLCTNSDPEGRARAVDLVPAQYGRLFPVGRLDQNSEGLLLLTNDGLLAQRLTHPRYEVPKKYKVQVAGFVESELIDQLKKGIRLAEALVQADEVIFKSRYKNSSILEIVLREGKNREIRRMLARLGHKVLQLQRTAIGPVKLMKMIPGEYRELTKTEIDKLFKAAGLPR